MKKFILSCDPGMEMLCAKEIKEELGGTAVPFETYRGKLKLKQSTVNPLLKLRTIHHVFEERKYFKIAEPTLEALNSQLALLELEEMLNAKSFRVSAHRVGEHEFGSMDAEARLGEILIRKYGTKVDLVNFELEVKLLIYDEEVYFGIQHTKAALSKRYVKLFNHRAALKTTLAYCMLQLAEVKEGETVLDPFCGSGTILMEAASLFQDKIKLLGSDLFAENVEGSRKNLEANNLLKFVTPVLQDARKLEERYAEIDKILCNPPYGIKSGLGENIRMIYLRFLQSADQVLKPDGIIVVITTQTRAMWRATQESGKFRVENQLPTVSGTRRPELIILRRN